MASRAAAAAAVAACAAAAVDAEAGAKPLDELERLLDEQHQEGRHDSSGVFTLDVERGLALLRRFQLPDPAFYLLKLVQAGSGAGEVRVRLAPDLVSVHAPGTCDFTPEELWSAMTSLSTPRTRALEYLAAGLAGYLADQPRHTAVWANLDTGRTLRLGSDVRSGQMPSMLGGGWTVSLNRPPAKGREEARLLESRCRFAPFPLSLNGKPLAVGGFEPGRAPLLAGFDYRPEAGLIRIRPVQAYFTALPGGFYYPQKVSPLRQPAGPVPREVQATRSGEPVECWAAFSVPNSVRGPDRLTVVRDGVALDPVEQPDLWWKGTEAVVAGDQLAVDLTGFKVVRDAAFDQLVAELAKRIRTGVGHARENLPSQLFLP